MAEAKQDGSSSDSDEESVDGNDSKNESDGESIDADNK